MPPDFSGEDVYRAMVNSSVAWVPIRTVGDHIILEWKPPDDHENSERKTVSIPLHDSLAIGTLRGISKDAGADDFERFCEWIESNL